LQVRYVAVVEDRPTGILSAEYCLPPLAKTDPPCSVVSLREVNYLSKTANSAGGLQCESKK